jgi:restriction system protein
MGSLNFSKGVFADHLHEIIGYKAGMAASIEHMCDLLNESGHADEIRDSEEFGLRIRSEDYEDLYYQLLHKVGVTDKPYRGILELITLRRELEKINGEDFSHDIFNIYYSQIKIQIELALEEGRKSLDPTAMLRQAHAKYGRKGFNSLMMVIEEYERLRNFNPQCASRWCEWSDVVDLKDLFSTYKSNVSNGNFFDQRFIDFLSVNQEKLGNIHWRKFEELIGECFSKFGYQVELGSGSNDDGVDLRVWKGDAQGAPEYIIQCKRQESKIDKVTVKGLYADVLEEDAEMGLLVTTSEFSPGARKTVDVRGYPIGEVNGGMIKNWLVELRTPGTGIVRV